MLKTYTIIEVQLHLTGLYNRLKLYSCSLRTLTVFLGSGGLAKFQRFDNVNFDLH